MQVPLGLGLPDTKGFAGPRRGEDISIKAKRMASLIRDGAKLSLGGPSMRPGSHGKLRHS